MAARHQVKCITKSDRTNIHERITHIGGINADDTRWRITQESAIDGIEKGTWEFYVSKAGNTANIIVSTSAQNNKYLKTENDGVIPDNLLSLRP